MTTAFPAAIDTFVNPTPGDDLSDPSPILHTDQHANINDAMAAVEARLGIVASTDPASIEFRLLACIAALAGKQATLVSGTNLKTVAGTSLLGAGDVPAGGGSSTYAALTDSGTVNLPVVNTALGTALGLKANAANAALTGVPTAPTPGLGTNTTQIATTASVRAEIAAIAGTAPGVLDTLGEISDALGDDPNFVTTMLGLLAGKVSSKANYALTGANVLTQATHSNAHGLWTGAAPATQTLPAVGAEGEWIECFNGGTADCSYAGAAVATGFTNVCPPGVAYEALYSGGTWNSALRTASAGGGTNTLIDGGASATANYAGVLAIDGGTATT